MPHWRRMGLLLASALCSASAFAACKASAEIPAAIEQLAQARTVDDAMPWLGRLQKDPYLAACYLVSRLRPVTQARLEPGGGAVSDGWAAVWRIRALRYLTGGLTFVASTRSKFGAGDTAREHLLTRDGPAAMPFFRVWPSRDLVFVAPADAQVAIIRRWRAWFERDAAGYTFKAASALEEWFF